MFTSFLAFTLVLLDVMVMRREKHTKEMNEFKCNLKREDLMSENEIITS